MRFEADARVTKRGWGARAIEAAILVIVVADEEEALARGGRDLETWLRALRALGAQGGGYRAAAIPRERLWQIVESPAADPSAREGAALALSAQLDEVDRERIAALAHNTAQPRLRVALDGVSRERDEARLRVALAAAEAELDEPASDGAPAAAATRGGA